MQIAKYKLKQALLKPAFIVFGSLLLLFGISIPLRAAQAEEPIDFENAQKPALGVVVATNYEMSEDSYFVVHTADIRKNSTDYSSATSTIGSGDNAKQIVGYFQSRTDSETIGVPMRLVKSNYGQTPQYGPTVTETKQDIKAYAIPNSQTAFPSLYDVYDIVGYIVAGNPSGSSVQGPIANFIPPADARDVTDELITTDQVRLKSGETLILVSAGLSGNAWLGGTQGYSWSWEAASGNYADAEWPADQFDNSYADFAFYVEYPNNDATVIDSSTVYGLYEDGYAYIPSIQRRIGESHSRAMNAPGIVYTHKKDEAASLKITKRVSESSDIPDNEANRDFEFKIVLSGTADNGQAASSINQIRVEKYSQGLPISSEYIDVNNCEFTVKLKVDEEASLYGIAEGLEYEAREVNLSENWIISDVDVRDVRGGSTVDPDTKVVSGEVRIYAQWGSAPVENGAEMYFTNAYDLALRTGSLKLTKLLAENTSSDSQQKFNFDITLTGTSDDGRSANDVDGEYSGVTFNDGVAHVELAPGASVNIDGLPSGLDYEIEEVNLPENWSISSQTAATGNIPEGATAEASVTNAYNITEAEISIEKLSTNEWFSWGGDNERARLSGAKFKIINKSGQNVATLTTTASGGPASVTLPVGEYTIVEDETPGGYASIGLRFDIDIQSSDSIIITNSYEFEQYIKNTNGSFIVYNDAELSIAKIDSAINRPLKDASLQLLSAFSGERTWNVEADPGELEDMTPGVYSISWTPSDLSDHEYYYHNYETSVFVVEDDGTIYANGQSIEPRRKETVGGQTHVWATLDDVMDNAGVSTSYFVVKMDLIDEWISGENDHIVKTPSYTSRFVLVERSAPDEYKKANPIVIDTYDQNKLLIDGEESNGHHVVMANSKIGSLVSLKKTFAQMDSGYVRGYAGSDPSTAGEKIARMKVANSQGETVQEFDVDINTISDNDVKMVLLSGTYTLIETEAPLGYGLADPIEFEVHNDGSVTINGEKVDRVVMRDNIEAKIQKADLDTGKSLVGAALRVLEVDPMKPLVDSWVNWVGDEEHKVTITSPGDYILFEHDQQVDNFTNQNTKIITALEDGRIVFDGKLTDATINKPFTLSSIGYEDVKYYDSESLFYSYTILDAKTVDSWESNGEDHEFYGPTDTYFLVEDRASDGYEVSKPIVFSLWSDGTVEIDGKLLNDNRVTMLDKIIKNEDEEKSENKDKESESAEETAEIQVPDTGDRPLLELAFSGLVVIIGLDLLSFWMLDRE